MHPAEGQRWEEGDRGVARRTPALLQHLCGAGHPIQPQGRESHRSLRGWKPGGGPSMTVSLCGSAPRATLRGQQPAALRAPTASLTAPWGPGPVPRSPWRPPSPANALRPLLASASAPGPRQSSPPPGSAQVPSGGLAAQGCLALARHSRGGPEGACATLPVPIPLHQLPETATGRKWVSIIR